MEIFEGERIWRILSNFWTIVTMAFVLANFYFENAYDALASPLSILYTGVLAIYVGTKEFDRWYAEHSNRHPGELFVLAWTALVFGMMFLGYLLPGDRHLPSDIIAVYIAVLTLFAFTQKSKQLYRRRKRS